MIGDVLKKEIWEKRRIEVTLRLLGRVDTMLTLIRERAGKQLDRLEQKRAQLAEQKKALDVEPVPAEQNAA